ncbi:cysteine hydrolase family protein [Bdellovibrio sp. HCB117]|uniref:cysteine hydrolase family protein n=1 Tax=Bdellovibrio sp. HCB117 TaxID=3394359 RepID=UPI0039B3697F
MKPNDVSRRHSTALLIIDMLNTFDFPEGKDLARYTWPVAQKVKALKQKLKKKKVPVIYLNDNFGQWRSDSKEVYLNCAHDASLGSEIAKILKPEDDDYFILKPRHSGFYCTNLDILLEDFGVKNLILTGVAGNICVFFTANDAHMRGFKIWVPKDCIASNTKKDNDFTLDQMSQVLGIKTSVSTRPIPF